MNYLFGGSPLVDWPDLTKLLVRLFLDIIFITLIVRGVYYRKYRNRDYVFTYYLFNTVTLLLCLLLRKVPTELGVALALFGVFGILRFRTEQIRSRDLTYLFVVIGIGVLNGVANKSVSVAELLVVNSIVVAMTALLELRPWTQAEIATPMLYDRLEFLKPGRDAELRADITDRTGLVVNRIEVHRVDLLRDAAEVTIHHRPRV